MGSRTDTTPTTPRLAADADMDRRGRALVRQLADQAFSRASGAQLREGNCVRLLKDAAQNYPAWLDAIHHARRTIHVEMYIIHDDGQGRLFADALIAKARGGVRVRLLYDWLGGTGNTSRAFWNRLRAEGVEVRTYNPLRFDSPFGWISRDHRKLIAVDASVGFVTGLCVGDAWVGAPARHLDPWRDTGIEVRGSAVADLEDAFSEAWASVGEPIDAEPAAPLEIVAGPAEDGYLRDVALRIVATVPDTAGLFRCDLLVAALARRTLWLTDAYYAGTTPYVQALRAAAQDGVDVRLLVPGSSDVPLVRPFSRAGYRPLLEAGVRVFEWNGAMLHAKTAVSDTQWARVGSTNLNLTSWVGNRELDAIVENEAFAGQMEAMYLADLDNATEVVLDARNRVRAPGAPTRRPGTTTSGGSGGRAVAGAMRIGSTVAAAVTNRRVLEPIEAHIALVAGILLAGLAGLVAKFPRSLAYPFAALAGWMAVTLLIRGVTLLRDRRRQAAAPTDPP